MQGLYWIRVKIATDGTSLLVQWLRIHLPMQGDVGLTPGWGTKIPCAKGQLRPHTTTRESSGLNKHLVQLKKKKSYWCTQAPEVVWLTFFSDEKTEVWRVTGP